MNFKTYLEEEDVLSNKLFTAKNASLIAKRLETNLEVPYIKAQVSTLGGKENVAIMITVSLDNKSTWGNNILQNSRYMMFHLYNNGTLERFASSHKIALKFRKTKIKDINQLFTTLNNYFQNILAEKS